MLLKYVKDVQPAIMENFIEQGPSPVVAAMRTTITNMLGTLPPQFFTVTISTVGENLSQLMYSVMMTGYMFRNAQYRLELRGSFGGVQFPNGSGAAIDMVQDSQLGPAGYAHGILDQTTYAPGVQKSKVQVCEWLLLHWVYGQPAASSCDGSERHAVSSPCCAVDMLVPLCAVTTC